MALNSQTFRTLATSAPTPTLCVSLNVTVFHHHSACGDSFISRYIHSHPGRTRIERLMLVKQQILSTQDPQEDSCRHFLSYCLGTAAGPTKQFSGRLYFPLFSCSGDSVHSAPTLLLKMGRPERSALWTRYRARWSHMKTVFDKFHRRLPIMSYISAFLSLALVPDTISGVIAASLVRAMHLLLPGSCSRAVSLSPRLSTGHSAGHFSWSP